jgi:hypothetical protein
MYTKYHGGTDKIKIRQKTIKYISVIQRKTTQMRRRRRKWMRGRRKRIRI